MARLRWVGGGGLRLWEVRDAAVEVSARRLFALTFPPVDLAACVLDFRLGGRYGESLGGGGVPGSGEGEGGGRLLAVDAPPVWRGELGNNAGVRNGVESPDGPDSGVRRGRLEAEAGESL